LLENFDDPTPINIESGEELTILDLSSVIAHWINYDGRVEWDTSCPDGALRKVLDTSKFRELSWNSRKHTLANDGLHSAVADYEMRRSSSD
jgi:GDP-L-fucose synthase